MKFLPRMRTTVSSSKLRWHPSRIPPVPRRVAVAATPASVTRCTGDAVAAEGRVRRECTQHALEEGGSNRRGGHEQDGQGRTNTALPPRPAGASVLGRDRNRAHPAGRRHTTPPTTYQHQPQ